MNPNENTLKVMVSLKRLYFSSTDVYRPTSLYGKCRFSLLESWSNQDLWTRGDNNDIML